MPDDTRGHRDPTELVAMEDLMALLDDPRAHAPDDAEMHRGLEGIPVTCHKCEVPFTSIATQSCLVAYSEDVHLTHLQIVCPGCRAMSRFNDPIKLQAALDNYHYELELRAPKASKNVRGQFEKPDNSSPAQATDLQRRILARAQAESDAKALEAIAALGTTDEPPEGV